MELYADSRSRGGVLEPQGTIGVKYRKRDILITARRIDPVLSSLCRSLANTRARTHAHTEVKGESKSKGSNVKEKDNKKVMEEVAELVKLVEQRESRMFPICQQVCMTETVCV